MDSQTFEISKDDGRISLNVYLDDTLVIRKYSEESVEEEILFTFRTWLEAESYIAATERKTVTVDPGIKVKMFIDEDGIRMEQSDSVIVLEMDEFRYIDEMIHNARFNLTKS